ncbi:HAD family hydrolase [Lactococcus nasutitermitis]|uniref:HAD family hydrolase n=1 Tax=Lactococcus nasutitermitis TaxID=1652957 RepID=A0ABV9JE75_9LACT|nr:HAD family hydrolase [Lactococcus nasutitermitis]
MTEAVVFDMDGVLIDSEYTYLESKTEILRDAGFPKPVSYQYQFMGTTYEFMWQVMKNELGLPEPIEYYMDEMKKRRQAVIAKDGVRPINGAVELVRRIHAAEIPLAVASSSPKSDILQALTALGIDDCFDKLVSGEEVAHSKPAPDVYLEAARQLGIAPENCLAFEDTKNGSRSAKAAGMYVIGFANPDYPVQDLSAADEVVKNYDALSAEILQRKIK